MSTEGENAKSLSEENGEKRAPDLTSSQENSPDDKDVKGQYENAKATEKGDAEIKLNDKTLTDKSHKIENDVKNEKKVENVNADKNERKTDNDTEEEEEEQFDKEEEGSDKDGEDKKEVPLLDQPLEQSGTRERKKVQRFNEDFPTDAKELAKSETPSGSGSQLGEIPRIDASISRFKNDDLKLLHRLLFKTPGKTTIIKKNIKKFSGFDFSKDSEEYTKKIASVQKFEVKQLKSVCEMLDLEKKGNKEELSERIVDFLLEPKDTGKSVGGGRPKRTAAVRANNRGYSSHDDSYSSDERHGVRSRRGKGKRTNLKDETTSESDEDFQPSEGSEDRPRINKRKSGGRKKNQSEDDPSEVGDSPSSEDSEDEPRAKRKKGSNKVANIKSKSKSTPKARGRKPIQSKKKMSPKRAGKKQSHDSSEGESEHQGGEASSSEDEPLVKKAKSPQPPTDEEIKTYVKEILEGANLEEITMKTVCKQVYAHYPDFDLAHKKDFIKTTVKSLIST